MHDDLAHPVIAGLGVGIAFLMIFGVLTSYFPVSVELKGDLDALGQRKAVDVLLTDPDVRNFVKGKKFEVWAYGANFPQSSLAEGVCERGECTLIGVRERNADGSVDCALKTFVNVETGRVDDVQYSSPCDEDERESRLSAAEYRSNLQARRAMVYELATNDPRVQKIIKDSLFHERDFEMLDHRDVVSIDTSKSMKVQGTWQSGYDITLSGKKLIIVDIVGDSITSVKIMSLPDERSSWNFTPNQKRMISITFSNPNLQTVLSGMSDGEDYHISAIRDRGIGDLGYVVISNSTNITPIFMTTVNQTSGEIYQDDTYPLG